MLIGIYNSAFYDDYIRYGECPAYGKAKEMMEKSIPGSGIIIRFVSPADQCEGQPININAIFGGRKIKYEYFKKDIIGFLRRACFCLLRK